jgi:hypothetical protein
MSSCIHAREIEGAGYDQRSNRHLCPDQWDPQEVADRAQEQDGMLSVFRAQPGFKAYGLAETQEGKLAR